jgi:hypothetical protein
MYADAIRPVAASATTGLVTPESGYAVKTSAPQYLSISDINAPSLTNRGRNQSYPIRHFRLAIDADEFKSFSSQFISKFRSLPWDLYDVRLKKKQAIEQHRADLSFDEQQTLLEYYRGNIPQEKIEHLLDCVPAAQRQQLQRLLPYRRKACSNLQAVILNDHRWQITPVKSDAILQRVALSDYRSIARKYKPLPNAILESTIFQNLLANVIHMVKDARPEARELTITTWMMSCYTWLSGPTTNSPEGIHQDGADFVVTAFVMERENVQGGISRVFISDMENPREQFLINAGEGLFHADAGSPLWHDVTHIEILDPNQTHGIRSVLGFDVDVCS